MSEKQSIGVIMMALAFLLWFMVSVITINTQLANIDTQLKRCADALNESNHIMVGVENGDVPGAPKRFDKAPPAKEF